MEERLDKIEETLALQERTLEQLSEVLTTQQAELNELHRQIRFLAERVKTAASEPSEEPPPPHYL